MSQYKNTTSSSIGDLNKIHRLNEEITDIRARILVLIYNEQRKRETKNKQKTIQIENLRSRINKLILMRNDEIMRVYSHVKISRSETLLSRSTSPRRHLPTVSSHPLPSTPLKITHIITEPNAIIINMVSTSFKPNKDIDKDNDIIYPEGVTDLHPYKIVARYRKAIGKSTNFRLNPLLVGEDSVETLVLGLESFAQQYGCILTFTDEDQIFDESIYHAVGGVLDLGSIHLLATDFLLAANFQFKIDLNYDSEFVQSENKIKTFVHDFCEVISKVFHCENNNVRVFSIDKLIDDLGKSQVCFGITTPDLQKTQLLANDLQTHARSGFATDSILRHVIPGEYECIWKPVLAYLQIRPSDLDAQYNFDYRKSGVPKEDTRGNRPYYLPIGWYRHALNVRHKYKGNQIWLGHISAEGEWPIAFHGTHSGAVTGIVEHGLLPTAVRTDAMIGEAIEQMGEEANRPGLYVATHCNGGSYPAYTTAFTVTTSPDKNEKFSLVFQCRVEPNKFTTHTGPVSVGEAWRIVDPNAVRPYGILLKKES